MYSVKAEVEIKVPDGYRAVLGADGKPQVRPLARGEVGAGWRVNDVLIICWRESYTSVSTYLIVEPIHALPSFPKGVFSSKVAGLAKDHDNKWWAYGRVPEWDHYKDRWNLVGFSTYGFILDLIYPWMFNFKFPDVPAEDSWWPNPEYLEEV